MVFVGINCVFMWVFCDVILVIYVIFVRWCHMVVVHVTFLLELVINYQSERSQADEKCLLGEESHEEYGCRSDESHGHDLSQARRYAEEEGEKHPDAVS